MFILLVFQDSRLFLLEFLEFLLKVLLYFVLFRKIQKKRDLDVHGRTVFGFILFFNKIKVNQWHELVLRQIRVLHKIMIHLFDFNRVFLLNILF